MLIFKYYRCDFFRLKLPKPVFSERQLGTNWSYDVQVGDLTVSCPVGRSKKKEARSEVARLIMKKLGAHFRPASSKSPATPSSADR